MSVQPGGDVMPKGIANSYFFQIFNMVATGMVSGAPMLLFFKEYGASEMVLGMVAAIPMLLFTLQIPAAKYVERVGYRRFVFRGWLVRPIFVLMMAVIAFLPDSISNTTRIGLMFIPIFGFSVTRGISMAGLLPWICALIPESIRGRFLSRDQMSIAFAGVVGSLLNAFLFSRISSHYSFGALFFCGLAFSLVALHFLRRIPDAAVPHAAQSREPTPWLKIVFHPPFLKVVIFNAVLFLAIGASNVFWVPFYRESLHLTKSFILLMGALESLAIITASYVCGRFVDRVGSKPLLWFACLLYALYYLGMAAMAAGIYPSYLPVVALLQILSGAGMALFTLASMRLVMAVSPELGRSHFLAFSTTANCITCGVVPILWGGILDSLSHWHPRMGGWEWNKYSFLYVVLTGIALAGQFFLHRVDEPRAAKIGDFLRRILGRPVSAS